MKMIMTCASLLLASMLISTTAMADPKHSTGGRRSPVFNHRGSQSGTNYQGSPSRWGYPVYPDYRWTLNDDRRFPNRWDYPRPYGQYSNRPHDYDRNRWDHSRPYGQYSNRPYASANDPWIQRGISDGRLSPAEIRELRQVQMDISRKEASYLRDGRLTEKEREWLEDKRSDYRDKLEHELNDGERR